MEPVSWALVPIRILEQVQLVIILRIPPRSRFHNLSHNRLPDGREMLVLDLLCNTLRNGLLFWGVMENTRSIFCERSSVTIYSSQRRKLTRSRIRPLSVQGRRVMGTIEKLCNSTQFRSGRISNTQLTHKLIVRHLVRIKLNPQRLSMTRNAQADRPIIWVRRIRFAPSVTNRSAQNALVICGRVML